MKKSTNYILLLLSFVLLPMFSSCFSDSDADDSPLNLDEKELAAYLKKMQGSYRGKLYYTYIGVSQNGAPAVKRDSLDNVEYTLNENGEMLLDRLPVSFISRSFEGTQYEFLADEIAKCEDVAMPGKYLPYRTMNGWDYPFLIYPKERIVLDVKHNGTNYKVNVNYMTAIKITGIQYIMEGVCRIHDNKMMVTLPLNVSLENTSEVIAPSMFTFSGIRKAPKTN